jgi:hypothetical protein
MKKIVLALLTVILPVTAQAAEIRSTNKQAKVARIVLVENLTKSPEDVAVNLVVEDLGGSTDMSPSQNVYLTIYRKGEMFSTDAAFLLMHAFSLTAVDRVSEGVYLITATIMDDEGHYVENAKFRIDARKALADIKKVDCGGDFDCDASEKFTTKISLVRE